jgi:hypothetical protein
MQSPRLLSFANGLTSLITREARARLQLQRGPANELARVQREARWLRARGPAWCGAAAAALDAGVALRLGRKDDSLQHFFVAAERFEELEMPLHVAAMMIRAGSVRKNAHSDELSKRAADVFSARGIKRVDRFVSIIAPAGASDA